MLMVFLTLVTSVNSYAVVVLQYHHVSNDTPAITSISPEDFHAHMDYLQKHQFNVISIERLIEALQTEQSIPDKSVVITFDDAYRDLLDNAIPVLIRYDYPATIFVATDLVGSSSHYLDWQELRRMHDTNNITMANHTVTHTHLLRMLPDESKTMWIQRLTNEIENAQKDLEKHIGETKKIFAYPYGEYDRTVANLIQELGYVAFGQQSGAIGKTSDRATLPRFPLSGNYTDLSQFKTKIATLALPLETQFIDPVATDIRPRLHLKLSNTDLSLRRLTCYGPGGPTSIEHVSAQEIIATPIQDIPVGRSRYNCTLHHEAGRYYWFSQPWIRKHPDGSWYDEP